jgi:hypothetical protein
VLEHVSYPTGRIRTYNVLGGRFRPCKQHPLREWQNGSSWIDNLVLYEWATIVGNLLLRQGVTYGISGMYIEFKNVADPADAVALPTVTRDASQGLEYYTALSASPDHDYIRVPLISGLLNSTDAVKFPKGNAPSFFAQTSGLLGVNGKPFSATANSKVYGGALVAFVSPSDSSQDLILSRAYLASGQQKLKLDSGQIGIEWALDLG